MQNTWSALSVFNFWGSGCRGNESVPSNQIRDSQYARLQDNDAVFSYAVGTLSAIKPIWFTQISKMV